MFIPGLVSVTFRQKTPYEICKLCARAHLRAIEWGGDVHVPPRSKDAFAIRRLSEDHGLTICSYGSYYRVGQPLSALCECLDTAQALGTRVVRIWAGSKGSLEVDERERQETVELLIAGAEETRKRGLTLALEYHGHTLTDERVSVQRLMNETAPIADVLSLYWQPRFDWPEAERLASLKDVRSRLSHLHVFTWDSEWHRLPLADEGVMWKKVFSSFSFSESHFALLEFVENDSEEALMRDAAVLIDFIQ